MKQKHVDGSSFFKYYLLDFICLKPTGFCILYVLFVYLFFLLTPLRLTIVSENARFR